MIKYVLLVKQSGSVLPVFNVFKGPGVLSRKIK